MHFYSKFKKFRFILLLQIVFNKSNTTKRLVSAFPFTVCILFFLKKNSGTISDEQRLECDCGAGSFSIFKMY